MYLVRVFEVLISLCSCFSPPERHHWGRRDRPVLLSSLVHDENFHHLLFSQHHQQVALDESRQYTHTSTASRMLHPTAAHLPQQSPIMVDLHDQVTEWTWNQGGQCLSLTGADGHVLAIRVPQPCRRVIWGANDMFLLSHIDSFCCTGFCRSQMTPSTNLSLFSLSLPPAPPPSFQRCTRDQSPYRTLLRRWRPTDFPSTPVSPSPGAALSSSQHAR